MTRGPDVGGINDRVRLILGGDEVLIAEDWDVYEGVLETPGTFSLTLGANTPFVDMFIRPQLQSPYPYGPKYPPGVPFVLEVDGHPQMAGKYEGWHFAEGDSNRITLKGRDQLGSLLKAHSESQRSFLNGTYSEMVQWAIDQVANGQQYTLVQSNAASRQIKAGIPISVISEPTLVDEVNSGATSGGEFDGTDGATVGAVVTTEKQNRIHENLLHFCRRHLDRAGLFLWSGQAPGLYILSQPNGQQKPIYRITRKRGQVQNSNVIRASYWYDTSDRHSQYTVYGRGGGGVAGRSKVHETYTDDEMYNFSQLPGNLGFNEEILYRDVNVENRQQAAFYGLRKAAEERRRGWGLVYTVRGHRAPGINPGDPWPVLTIDTTIMVDDDEFALGPSDPEGGIYYVESVRRMRRPETCTQIRLMRIRDLIFGTGGIA